MAFHNDIDAFVFRDAKGRVRHFVRAALGQTHDGAHGVTRPTRPTHAKVVVICHISRFHDPYPSVVEIISPQLKTQPITGAITGNSKSSQPRIHTMIPGVGSVIPVIPAGPT